MFLIIRGIRKEFEMEYVMQYIDMSPQTINA